MAGKLIFEIEDLGHDLPRLVRGASGHEEIAHRLLPARVDLGPGDLLLRPGEIVGLGVPDQQAVVAQEVGVVPPAGIAQATAPIDVLAVEEQRAFQATDRLDRRPAHQDERAADPVHVQGVAPPGLPAAVTDKIRRDVEKALADDDFKAKFAAFGYEPFPVTRVQFDQFIRSESARQGDVIKKAKVSLD